LTSSATERTERSPGSWVRLKRSCPSAGASVFGGSKATSFGRGSADPLQPENRSTMIPRQTKLPGSMEVPRETVGTTPFWDFWVSITRAPFLLSPAPPRDNGRDRQIANNTLDVGSTQTPETPPQSIGVSGWAKAMFSISNLAQMFKTSITYLYGTFSAKSMTTGKVAVSPRAT